MSPSPRSQINGWCRNAIMLSILALSVVVAQAAPQGELESRVLDAFSTLNAWSARRSPTRLAADYARWDMGADADGDQGSCLRMSFIPRGPSADIWGALRVEEPVDTLSMMIRTVSRGPAQLTVALVEEDGSNYISAPMDLNADGAWRPYDFPVAAFTEAPWQPDENGKLDFPTSFVVLVVTGMAQDDVTSLCIDELTTRSPRPARWRLVAVDAPRRVAAGDSFEVSASLMPLDVTPEGTGSFHSSLNRRQDQLETASWAMSHGSERGGDVSGPREANTCCCIDGATRGECQPREYPGHGRVLQPPLL